MKTTLPLLALLTIVLAPGCATEPDPDPSARWQRGTLTRLDDGFVMQFRIEPRDVHDGSAAGGLVAIDPANPDRFTGQYVTLITSASGRLGNRRDEMQLDIANTQGALSDHHGHVIQLKLDVRAGHPPHGMGTGQDNQARQYQVLF